MKINKELFDSLTAEEQLLKDKLTKVRDTIKNLQSLCDHSEWLDAGHDSHYSWVKCKDCGFEEKA